LESFFLCLNLLTNLLKRHNEVYEIKNTNTIDLLNFDLLQEYFNYRLLKNGNISKLTEFRNLFIERDEQYNIHHLYMYTFAEVTIFAYNNEKIYINEKETPSQSPSIMYQLIEISVVEMIEALEYLITEYFSEGIDSYYTMVKNADNLKYFSFQLDEHLEYYRKIKCQ
jgi:hypothetical protein